MKSGEYVFDICVRIRAEEEYTRISNARVARVRGFNIKSNDVAKVRS